MKLAIASEDDFAAMWKVYRALDLLQYANTDLRRQRLERLIVGRLEALGIGGFCRILMGCEMLIDNCCDKTSEVYDLSPKLKEALSLLEKSRANQVESDV
ncbi:hypothetical protein BM525_19000 (plasmid) [Alteromonas mediterranea]|uniref:Uncharacterized protein n=1 Tax=Alteromonas mediterranea TaxID=314275 RepID=A0AAC9JHD4_9ALTE|nr:hypothetical protein [Alteromonas mediterranea]APD91972.1 hypothetical protein BM524_18805 [Alteromonas mediterranea]APD99826.1 hypothetical protein BM525_19000 [Alteromonas mediterranea]